MRTRLVLGGPGTGKTTRLVGYVEEHLNRGTPPQRIAFVSFTRAAAGEAAARFDLDPNDMPYFSTIHAMCFRELGVTKREIMGKEDIKNIADTLGLEMTGRSYAEDTPGAGTKLGDRCLSLISFARATRQPLRDVWQTFGEDIDWFRLKQLADTLQAYKGDMGKLDFDDLLYRYLREEAGPLPVDVAVIDEAQDLTAAQWAVARAAFKCARHILIGGDDDQAIYEWSGADVKTFLSLKADREVLTSSRRLPQPVWDLGERLVKRISRRYPKEWKAAEHAGSVDYAASIDELDFTEPGTWMVLARNGYLLRDLGEELQRQGVVYVTRTGSSVDPAHIRAVVTWERFRNGKEVAEEDLEFARTFTGRRKVPPNTIWHDALVGIGVTQREYYRSVLRRGIRLQSDPSVRLETIHGVKGAEADNVVLMTDISWRTNKGYELNPDVEHRVFYVGATRARKRLIVVENQTDTYYTI